MAEGDAGRPGRPRMGGVGTGVGAAAGQADGAADFLEFFGFCRQIGRAHV